jgi:tRNA uridine 5-carboxymethylaminomethyl modification enzyme
MLTSRCEYRLLLRPDTARERLAGIAYEHGLIDDAHSQDVEIERRELAEMIEALESVVVFPRPNHNALLEERGLAPVNKPMSAAELLRRPGTNLAAVTQIARQLGSAIQDSELVSPERVESEVRYGAFLERESKEVARQAALQDRTLPELFDYAAIPGLRIEAANKLAAHKPRTIGEAGRLAGVTPSDVGALLIHLRRTDRAPVPI